MPQACIPTVSAFVLAYSSFISSYLLAGFDKKSILLSAALPSLAAALVSLLPHGVLMIAAALLCAAAGFIVAFKLSGHNGLVSLLALFMAASFMFSWQLIQKMLLPTAARLLLLSLLSLLLPAALYLSKISIFFERPVLTGEQRRGVLRRMLCFFPGLVLLMLWQAFLLLHWPDNAICFVIFTLLLHFLTLFQLRMQVQAMQERIENIIDKQYQAELLSFMQVIRSQRHDFNFHMQTINALIESEAYPECRDYVRSMMQTVSAANEILPLYHPATSALLNAFREMAFQKGLQMEIEIHDNLQFIATSVFETNTILGNLLQNAIDELEMHPESESRIIHLLIIKRGQYNIIKVSNRCHLSAEAMKSMFKPGFTTKQSHEGLGLANALRVAERYDGTLYPEFEGNIIHFIARIPLRDYRQF